MIPTSATTDLLDRVARGLPGAVSLTVLDAQGDVVHRAGELQPAVAVGPQNLGSQNPNTKGLETGSDAGLRHTLVALPSGEGAVMATWHGDRIGADATDLLQHLVAVAAAREQLEQDMESMNAGSLALLEEVSMMGETLPSMATGASDQAIAAEAIKALLVTTSVERAMFLAHDATTGWCQVMVHASLDASGFQGVEEAYGGDSNPPADCGMLAKVLSGVGNTVHLTREPGEAPLGPEGSPEAQAEQDILAVPVTCGSGDQLVMLGAIVIMDKRPNSFSHQPLLGSQETKLAQAIAAMLGAVLGARQVAEMGKELAMAQQIQEQILPLPSRDVAGFDLYAAFRTSGEVGGDYFDYLALNDGRTMAVVADVSGHNLASGMVMVSARAALKVLAAAHDRPGEIFTALAASLHDDLTRTERFITAAALTLTPGGQHVELVSAGHNDVMWFHAATGEVERLPSDATIFGFLPGAQYPSRSLEVAVGDVLLLYTDGVTEAVNEHSEMFTEERLCNVLAEAATGEAKEIIAAVFGAVRGFADSRDRGDDITAIAIKSTAKSGARL